MALNGGGFQKPCLEKHGIGIAKTGRRRKLLKMFDLLRFVFGIDIKGVFGG